MARFYFHLLAGAERIRDEAGLDLATTADAIEQGRRALYELSVEAPEESDGFTGLEIRDEADDLILRAPFSRRPGAIPKAS